MILPPESAAWNASNVFTPSSMFSEALYTTSGPPSYVASSRTAVTALAVEGTPFFDEEQFDERRQRDLKTALVLVEERLGVITKTTIQQGGE